MIKRLVLQYIRLLKVERTKGDIMQDGHKMFHMEVFLKDDDNYSLELADLSVKEHIPIIVPNEHIRNKIIRCEFEFAGRDILCPIVFDYAKFKNVKARVLVEDIYRCQDIFKIPTLEIVGVSVNKKLLPNVFDCYRKTSIWEHVYYESAKIFEKELESIKGVKR